LTPGQLWYRESYPILYKHFATLKLSDSDLLKLANSLNFEFDRALGLEPVVEVKLWLTLRSRNQLFDLKEKLLGTQSVGWTLLNRTLERFLPRPEFPRARL
jgi:hypothetical protein